MKRSIIVLFAFFSYCGAADFCQLLEDLNRDLIVNVNKAIRLVDEISGEDIQFCAHRTVTPLILAVMGGSSKVVVRVLQKGAEINAQPEPMKRTALMEAALSCFHNPEAPVIVSLLLQAGADKDLKDGHGETALALLQSYLDKFDIKPAFSDISCSMVASLLGEVTPPSPISPTSLMQIRDLLHKLRPICAVSQQISGINNRSS